MLSNFFWGLMILRTLKYTVLHWHLGWTISIILCIIRNYVITKLIHPSILSKWNNTLCGFLVLWSERVMCCLTTLQPLELWRSTNNYRSYDPMLLDSVGKNYLTIAHTTFFCNFSQLSVAMVETKKNSPVL